MNVNISQSILLSERSKNYIIHASFWIIYLYQFEFIVYSTFEKYFFPNVQNRILIVKMYLWV